MTSSRRIVKFLREAFDPKSADLVSRFNISISCADRLVAAAPRIKRYGASMVDGVLKEGSKISGTISSIKKAFGDAAQKMTLEVEALAESYGAGSVSIAYNKVDLFGSLDGDGDKFLKEMAALIRKYGGSPKVTSTETAGSVIGYLSEKLFEGTEISVSGSFDEDDSDISVAVEFILYESLKRPVSAVLTESAVQARYELWKNKPDALDHGELFDAWRGAKAAGDHDAAKTIKKALDKEQKSYGESVVEGYYDSIRKGDKVSLDQDWAYRNVGSRMTIKGIVTDTPPGNTVDVDWDWESAEPRVRDHLKPRLSKYSVSKDALVKESIDGPIMEPGFVKTAADEQKWAKAKKATGEGGADNKYALANHIFQKMKGESELKENTPQLVRLVSNLLAELGFTAASQDVTPSNYQRYLQIAYKEMIKLAGSNATRLAQVRALGQKLGVDKKESRLSEARGPRVVKKAFDAFIEGGLSGERTPVKVPVGTIVSDIGSDMNDPIFGEPVTYMRAKLGGKVVDIVTITLPSLNNASLRTYFESKVLEAQKLRKLTGRDIEMALSHGSLGFEWSDPIEFGTGGGVSKVVTLAVSKESKEAFKSGKRLTKSSLRADVSVGGKSKGGSDTFTVTADTPDALASAVNKHLSSRGLLTEGTGFYDLKNKSRPSEQVYFVIRDGAEIGYVSKLKDTATEKHPWKAFTFPPDRAPGGRATYLGAAYGSEPKEQAIQAVLSGSGKGLDKEGKKVSEAMRKDKSRLLEYGEQLYGIARAVKPFGLVWLSKVQGSKPIFAPDPSGALFFDSKAEAEEAKRKYKLQQCTVEPLPEDPDDEYGESLQGLAKRHQLSESGLKSMAYVILEDTEDDYMSEIRTRVKGYLKFYGYQFVEIEEDRSHKNEIRWWLTFKAGKTALPATQGREEIKFLRDLGAEVDSSFLSGRRLGGGSYKVEYRLE